MWKFGSVNYSPVSWSQAHNQFSYQTDELTLVRLQANG